MRSFVKGLQSMWEHILLWKEHQIWRWWIFASGIHSVWTNSSIITYHLPIFKSIVAFMYKSLWSWCSMRSDLVDGCTNVTSQLHSGTWIPVSVETAQNWLHEMGFEVLTGIFIDGHEWPEVVASRVEFFRQMVKNRFLAFYKCTNRRSTKGPPWWPTLDRHFQKRIMYVDDPIRA